MKRAILFPGQGSQKPGMGKALAEQFDIARQTFAQADEALGFAISELCFSGPATELNLTANSQPAILATSIAAFRCWQAHTQHSYEVAAGHSLGEWSALVAAGAMDFADAIKLVHLRGQAMQDAVAVGVGAMAAIIGLEASAVRDICIAAQSGQVCSPANYNGGKQIVISGHTDAVQRAMVQAKSAGGRAIPLKVSAPFHCELMAPAADKVGRALAETLLSPMSVPVISNVTAQAVQTASDFVDLLTRQVTQSVRWQESVEFLVQAGVQQAWEFGHGSVLKGLCKRITSDIAVQTIGTPDDISS